MLQRSVTEENKWIFDQLQGERHEIEDQFGDQLLWQRLDERKSSRISYSHPFDGFNDENWPAMIEWLCKHFVKLDKSFSKPLGKLKIRN